MLTHPQRHPDETPTLPPHLRPYHSLRFHTPALTIFMLTWFPPDMPLTPLAILKLVALRHPYACVVPSQHAPDTTYPYDLPSRHAPNTTSPYACVVPSRHAPDTTYPYAYVVPSRHPPDTAYHPYARGVHSQHHLSLCLCSALPTCSRHHPVLNETSHDEAPHIESPPIPNETIHDATPPVSPRNIQAFQERETIKHNTMGRDMTDIFPDPEPRSTSANFQGIFLSRMEECAGILNYHSNITQQKWKRGLENIKSIYKNQWDNLPTKDAHTFLPIGIKVISNQELKMLAWLEDLEMAGLDFFKPTETEAFFDHNIWNLTLMKESAEPPDNLPKSEHSFFKMVQSLVYPTKPVNHFWANFIFESISSVSYDVIAPKPYVAPTSNLADPYGLKRGAVEYLASCLSKSKQCETQLSIEGGGADNEISTKLHKNLKDLMDTVIHLMIAYNMVCAHTKVKFNGIKDKLTNSKKNEAIKELLMCHKNLGINQICYGILVAFCESGVREGKNLVEPVWLRTNKYICNLLNKSFFSSESFNPTVPLRFEFARCLVLDFGDAWVAKRGLGSSDEVTLTVPRSAKLTTRIDPF
ncbi:hypothetical protein O181_034201 [Austropuccinia psidii MF-1]|uniref:Uncharacterized protein n=1 Tax=Austropuccinia psidii MF-1 TaxID=1389203 RepID=A0A9Q3H7T1_9BASI|nr:hypothetical protein [Austropuccinia psidii MF-1]